MTREEIDKLILKARVCYRLLEVETWRLTRNEERIELSYYINIKDKEYILYIPCEVTSIANHNDIATDRLFRTGSKVRVIGGKNLTNTRNMFCNVELEELDLTEAEFTKNLKVASKMFYKCHINNIIGATFNITNTSNRFTREMFYYSDLGETNLSIKMDNDFELPYFPSDRVNTDIDTLDHLMCNSLYRNS